MLHLPSIAWGATIIVMVQMLCANTASAQATVKLMLAGVDSVLPATNDFNGFVRSLPKLKPVTVGVLPDPSRSADVQFTGADRCDRSPVKEGANISQIAAFAPNAQTLWTGAIIQGASATGGILTPITLPRRPLVVTATAIGIAGPGVTYSATVDNPSLATVTDGIMSLVARLAPGPAPAAGSPAEPVSVPRATPARISHEVKQFSEMNDAYLRMNGQYEWITGSVKAELDKQSTSYRTNFLLQFVQAYYDISVNPPSTPKQFFKQGLFSRVSTNDLTPHVQPLDGVPNPPLYVSTITYGRMLILFVSSTETADKVRATLEAVYNAVASKGRVSITKGDSAVLRASELRLLALGGPAGGVTKLLSTTTAVGDLTHYFTSGETFGVSSPGVPISFQLRYLTGESAQIGLTTAYSTRTCRSQKVVGLGMRFETTDEDKDNGDIVTGSITWDGTEVYRWPEFGRRHHIWRDWTSQPDPGDAQYGRTGWFFSALGAQYQFPIDRLCRVRAVVSKTGDRGWHGKMFVGALLEDGSFSPDLLSTGGFRLGKDDDGTGSTAAVGPSC